VSAVKVVAGNINMQGVKVNIDDALCGEISPIAPTVEGTEYIVDCYLAGS
jgi:hypothetical protein